jgi:3-methyladenine DNA glycosylase AlkD
MDAKTLQAELQIHANANVAANLAQFFKANEGGYGEGDQFLGVKVPVIRAVCKSYRNLPLADIDQLLESPIHEDRMAALIVLSGQALKADPAIRKQLYEFYVRHTNRINNWDLVDVSCRDVVGAYLLDEPRNELYELAKSDNLWERRIAIVSTWEFIRHRQLDDTLAIAEVLLHDKHDLIQKAVGWMLREVGKRESARLVMFLDTHAHEMPRTMLRYAIEHFPPDQRQQYLSVR